MVAVSGDCPVVRTGAGGVSSAPPALLFCALAQPARALMALLQLGKSGLMISS